MLPTAAPRGSIVDMQVVGDDLTVLKSSLKALNFSIWTNSSDIVWRESLLSALWQMCGFRGMRQSSIAGFAAKECSKDLASFI
jgi:hypothetical protein